jgi:uncharacterized protein YgiM (DUF1202 family)
MRLRFLLLTVAAILVCLVAVTTRNQASTATVYQKPAENGSCKISAYVIDRDPAGLNVRSGPNSTSSIVSKLAHADEGPIVSIVGSNGKWMLIDSAESMDSEEVFKGSGWVYGLLLGTSTRYKVNVRKEPRMKSQVIGTIAAEEEVKLTGCKGGWARIQYGNLEGWIEPEAQCPNPVTTCP